MNISFFGTTLLSFSNQAKPQFDTLGSTAAEVARKHAEKESAGSAIPGPAPFELIIPVGDPMGKRLLRTMGWREGQGVGRRVSRRKRLSVTTGDESQEDELPEKARAGLSEKARALIEKQGLTFAPQNTELKVQSVLVKTNLHGVGHDPFKDAPEFGTAHSVRSGGAGTRGVYKTDDLVHQSGDAVGLRGSVTVPATGRGSHGFVVDDGEDDVYEAGFGKELYDDALDADGGGVAPNDSLAQSAKAWASSGVGGEDEPVLTARRYARCPSDGRLPPTGFVVAQQPDDGVKHWAPPIPPASFNPTHNFEKEAETNPPRIFKNEPGIDSRMDASRRAKILGEPGLTSANDPPAFSPALPTQGSLPLAANASVFSLLSPAARKKVLDAANGVRAPSAGVSVTGGGKRLGGRRASEQNARVESGAQTQVGACKKKEERLSSKTFCFLSTSTLLQRFGLMRNAGKLQHFDSEMFKSRN